MKINFNYNEKNDYTKITLLPSYKQWVDGGIEKLDFLKDSIGLLQAEYDRQKKIDSLNWRIKVTQNEIANNLILLDKLERKLNKLLTT